MGLIQRWDGKKRCLWAILDEAPLTRDIQQALTAGLFAKSAILKILKTEIRVKALFKGTLRVTTIHEAQRSMKAIRHGGGRGRQDGRKKTFPVS